MEQTLQEGSTPTGEMSKVQGPTHRGAAVDLGQTRVITKVAVFQRECVAFSAAWPSRSGLLSH